MSCNWPLGNGHTLKFDVYGQNQGWNQVAGLYIFAYQSGNNWYALYVGQTDDFSSRLTNHERLQEAVNLGATHIHACVVPTQSERDRLEKLLIQNLQPRLNTQLK